MPIEVVCPSCTRQFRVPDKVAGKKIKCPKCAGVLPVPGGPASGVGSAVGSGSSVGGSAVGVATKKWYLKTPDGSQYGPVPRPELDQWFGEGRITAQCQLLEEGAPQWQWATDLYPQLNPASGTTSQTVATSTVPMQAPAQAAPTQPAPSDNPFAGLGESNPTPADNPFAAMGGGTTPAASTPAGNPAEGAGGGSNDPFSFAGADTSPTSRIRGGRRGGGGGRRKRKSGAITTLSMLSYLLGGIGISRALLRLYSVVTMPPQVQLPRHMDPEAARFAQGAMGAGMGIAVVIIILFGIYAGLYLLAGFGLQERREWGRIFTLVLAAFTGIFALFQMSLVFFLLSVLSQFSMAPKTVLLLIMGILTILASMTFAIMAYVVLLQKKYADEFS